MDETDVLEGDIVKTYFCGLLTGLLMKHAKESDDLNMIVHPPVMEENGIYADYVIVTIGDDNYRVDITRLDPEIIIDAEEHTCDDCFGTKEPDITGEFRCAYCDERVDDMVAGWREDAIADGTLGEDDI